MKNKKVLANSVLYKVVEISTVTDEVIEQVLNQWTSKGWQFDQIQFVVRDASRRPGMGFLFFTRPAMEKETSPLYEKIVYKTPQEEIDAKSENKETRQCD